MTTKKKSILSKTWKIIKPKSIKSYIRQFIYNRRFFVDIAIREGSQEIYDNFYSKEKPQLDIKGKRVVFIYNKDVNPPVGLADRLRGIIIAYNCVKALNETGRNIDFSINFTLPFQLSEYLAPNTYNWTIKQDDISYNIKQTEFVYLYSILLIKKKAKYITATKYLKSKIKRSKYNQIHIFTNILLKGKYQEQNFSSSFHELFKPTPALQAELDRHTAAIGGEYIDITLRFQNLLGDFYEGEQFKPLESDEQKRALIEQCMEQVEKIHLRHPDKRILVTSDSRTFLNEVDKKTYTYTIDGKLVHMATTDDNSFNLHLKAFVDFLMISRAEKIYLLRTGQMYNSGFPRTAAQINNREFEYIEF